MNSRGDTIKQTMDTSKKTCTIQTQNKSAYTICDMCMHDIFVDDTCHHVSKARKAFNKFMSDNSKVPYGYGEYKIYTKRPSGYAYTSSGEPPITRAVPCRRVNPKTQIRRIPRFTKSNEEDDWENLVVWSSSRFDMDNEHTKDDEATHEVLNYYQRQERLIMNFADSELCLIKAPLGEPCIENIADLRRSIDKLNFTELTHRYEDKFGFDTTQCLSISPGLFLVMAHLISNSESRLGLFDDHILSDSFLRKHYIGKRLYKLQNYTDAALPDHLREELSNSGQYFEAKRQEMDVGSAVTATTNSTTIVQNTEPVSEENEDEVISLPQLEQASTESKFQPHQLLDRWIRLDSFRWDGTGLAGSQYRTYELPKALGATTAGLCESLVTNMWQLNRTQRVGMEVRVICPSQAMISGKMLMKFYYEAFADRDIQYRFNPYSMSQGKNVGIRPGAKTAAALTVHFNNRNASFSNQTTQFDKESVLNLGTLVLTELNRLRAGPDVAPVVDVSVEIRFINATFHGRIPSTVLTTPKANYISVRQEGLIKDIVGSDAVAPILDTVSEIETMLNSVRTTDNEDKPVDIGHRVVMIPRFTESFSAGTGIGEFSQPMRLDVKGRKPAVLKSGNSNDIKKMCSDWGLFRQVTWSTTMNKGTVLATFPIEPVCKPEEYQAIVIGDNVGFGIPPVDVVTSNHTFFSGNLEYKIEVINTAFHNGALLCGTVPLVDREDVSPDLTINQLSNVKREIFELGNGMSEMIVKTDFHNLNHLMGVRSSDRFAVTPRRSMGMAYIMVSSILQANVNASQTVDINIYKRGAEDFEPSEMKAAILSPAYDAPLVLSGRNHWRANSGNSDWYAGTFNQFNNGTLPVLRFGSLLGEVEEWIAPPGARFTGWPQIALISRNPTAEGEITRNFELEGTMGVVPGATKFRFTEVVLMPWMDTYGVSAFPYVYEYFSGGQWLTFTAQLIINREQAFQRVGENPSDVTRQAATQFMITTTAETEYFGLSFSQPNNGTFIVGYGNSTGNQLSGGEAQEQQEQQGDNVKNVRQEADTTAISANNNQASASTANVFGEEKCEIISIMRRPIYRTSFTYNPSTDLQWPLAHVSVQATHRYNPINYSDPVDLANRYTPQGILQTGYLWVSGSLSRRVMAPVIPDTNMWIMHKVYDKPNHDLFLQIYDARGSEDPPVYIQGIAYEMTSLGVNNHLNVSLPWKQENVRNLLCRRPLNNTDKAVQQAYDIGRTQIGFQNLAGNTTNINYTVSIFDSYGDDCELSGYRGFPLMQFNDQLEDFSAFKTVRQEMDTGKTLGLRLLEKTGIVDAVEKKVEEAAERIEMKVRADAGDVVTVVKDEMNKLMQTVMSEYVAVNTSKLTCILAGEAMHMIANPDMKTLLVSFLNVFLQLGFYNLSILQSLLTEIGSLLGMNQPEQSAGVNEVKQESEAQADIMGSIVSLLASGICSYLGWHSPLVKTIDWKVKYAMAFPSFIGMAWSFKRFMNAFFPTLKWIFDVIMKMKVYITDEVEAGFIDSSKNMLTAWISEVNTLCREGHVILKPMDRDRIMVAKVIADILERKLLIKSTKFQYFRKYVDKIRELHDKMLAEGDVPYVRKEPFCIWLYGLSGVGKSHIIDSITTEIMVANDIPVPNEKVLILNPASKYVTRVNGQVEMRIDDFMAITSAEANANQLSFLFDVMTCAPYNPVQAEVDKKSQLFAPKFLTICANSAYPLNAAVQHPEAFIRRRNVTVEVSGDDDYLLKTFGEEFKDLKSKQGFLYGHLPRHMKKDNKHLSFRFMRVDPSTALPEAIKVQGRARHDWQQFMALMQEEYKTYDSRANASYQSRMAEFWRVKGMEVPDFHNLISMDDEPVLSIIVSKWIAEFEKDHAAVKMYDDIIAKSGMHTNNYPRLTEVVKTFYGDGKRQEGMLDGVDKDTYITRFPEESREQVTAAINKLKVENIAYGNSSEYLVAGQYEPLMYHILHNVTCNHKLTGTMKQKIDILFRDQCTSKCIVNHEVQREILPWMAVQAGDPKTKTLVRKFFDTIPDSLSAIFKFAADKIKWTMKKVYSGIKFLGVSLYDFVTNHWKVLTVAVGGFAILYYSLVSNGKARDYIAKITPSGEWLTSAGKPLRSLLASVGLGSQVIRVGQEGYNEKVRVTTSKATGPVKQVYPQSQTHNIDANARLVRDGFMPFACEMNDDYFRYCGRRTFVASCFRYGGRKAIMVRHEYEIMTKYSTKICAVLHTKQGKKFTVDVATDQLKWIPFAHYGEKGDLRRFGNFGTIDLPVQIPPARNLIRMKDGDVSFSIFAGDKSIDTGDGLFIAPPRFDEKGMYYSQASVPYKHTTVTYRTTAEIDADGRPMTSVTTYSNNYDYPLSKCGYCLGMLMDEHTGKIMGIHFAGDGHSGNAEKVLTSMLPTDDVEYEIPCLKVPDDSFDAISSSVLPVGHVAERHQQSSATKITKSTIHGCVDVTTAPAILSPQDERNKTNWSPLYEGVKKHGLPPKPFPVKWVDMAKEDFLDKILTLPDVLKNEVSGQQKIHHLTIEEAVFGIPGVLNSMDFTTSLGYGWKGYGKGKTGVVDPLKRWIHPEVTRRVHELRTKFENNVIPFVLSVDCLKDETLKTEKIEKVGSTRIISTMPFEYQILLRMFTSRFVISHQYHNLSYEHAIGISVVGPKSTTFDRLGKILEGGKILAGDFKNFGPGASAQVASAACEIIEKWYEAQGADTRILRNILKCLVNTPHLTYDKVYQTCCGIISGSGLTVVLNTMIHSLYMRIAACGLGISLYEWNENVVYFTYGDDGIGKVLDPLIGRYNMLTLEQFFADYGIIYTSVDKQQNTRAWCELNETSFLKHGFRLEKDTYLAALDVSSIENQLNWVSKIGNVSENTKVNVEMALEQAFNHGSEYFEILREKVNRAFRKKGIFANLPRFENIEMKRYNVSNEPIISQTLMEQILEGNFAYRPDLFTNGPSGDVLG